MNKKQPEQYEFDQRDPLAATGTDTPAPAAVAHDLRRIAAERLAAHRQRRNRLRTPEETAPEPAAPHNPIAAAVFERYSQSPSYRAVLAEQAQRAIHQANSDAEAAVAEAEVAARNAHAVAEAQKRLLAELQLWNAPQIFSSQTAETFGPGPKLAPSPTPDPLPTLVQRTEPQPTEIQRTETQPTKTQSEDPWDWSADSLPGVKPAPTQAFALPVESPETAPEPLISLSELEALEQEIAFRQAPVFEPFAVAPEPIPANIVEFPRQIVAPRKARPRLAELPSFDVNQTPQLRIFEAEPEALVPVPQAAAYVATPTPAWADLRLDADHPTTPVPLPEEEIVIRESVRSASYQEAFGEEPTIQAAPFGLRVMASAADLMLVAFSLLFALSVTARIVHRLPSGAPALFALAASLLLLWTLYLLLFFSFSDQTPGMRFARIGFCCFNDEAPTRAAIRRRILSQFLALAPLGAGIFAALFDAQKLGWHDRISQMYPRSY